MEIKSLTQALKVYNRIEDERDRLRAEYDAKESKLKAAQTTVQNYMMEEMQVLGLTSFEVPGQGVASIRVKRRFGAADWSLVWDFIIANKCPEMLQKRLLDTAVQKYLDTTGELPPGVNTEAWQVVAVTKRG